MAHIRDRGRQYERRWQARYRDLDGQQVSRTFKRKIDAQRWLDEVTADLVTGRYVDPRAGRVTLAEYAGKWLDSQTFDEVTWEGTERRLRLHILPQLGRYELRALKPSTIQGWLRGRLDVAAPSSVRVMLVNLSAILSSAVADGLIPSNPCQSTAVKPPAAEKKRIIPWTIDQVTEIIQAHPAAWRAVPILAAGCGLRQGECLGLQLDDVDFLGRSVLVRRQVKIINGAPTLAPPKGRRDREVPLPNLVAMALSEHLQRHLTDGQVFTWRDGGLIHRTYYNNQVWRPALKAVGMTPGRETGMHQLRHHFASVLLDGGVSIKAVSEYLGHASAKTTLDIYAHLMPDTQDRARAVIDAAHAPGESTLNRGIESG